MRTRLLDIVGELTTRRPGVVLAVALLVGAVGAWLGLTRLPLDADTDNLIRQDRPFMVRYRGFLDEFGDLEFIFAVIDTQPSEPRAVEAARALEDRLRTIDGLRAVHGSVTVEEQLRLASRASPDAELGGLALVGMGLGALAEASAGPESAGAVALARVAGDLLRQATRPTVDATGSRDPESLVDAQGSPPSTSDGGPSRSDDLRTGPAAQAAGSAILILRALLSVVDSGQAAALGTLAPPGQRPIPLRADGGRYLLIQILPVKDFGTATVIEGPLRAIRSAIAETTREFPEVQIGLTGKPVLQADELRTSNADMVRGASIGLALCAILLMVATRSVMRPLLCVCAFVVAFAWTSGFAALAVGRLNLLSMVFMLVLVANGLDYGVHVVARYLEARDRSPGTPVARAMQDALRVALRGNLTGALTSCAVFLTALATNFQGLRELGFIASAGLLLCVVAMGSVLPALMVFVERRHSFAVPHLVGRGLGNERSRWLTIPIRRPAIVLAVVGVATLALGLALSNLRFEENLLNLQNPTLDSVRWERRLAAESAGNSWFGAVVVEDIGQVERARDLAARQPAIGAVRSVLDLIQRPTPGREEMRRLLGERAGTGRRLLRKTEEALAAGPSGAEEPTDVASALGNALEKTLGPLRLVVAGAASSAPEEAALLGTLVSAVQRTVARLAGRSSARPGPSDGGSGPSAILAQCDEGARAVGRSAQAILDGDAAPLREALPGAVRGSAISQKGRFLLMLHPRENVWDAEHMREFTGALRTVDPQVTGVPFTHYESLLDMRRAFLTMAGLSVVLVAILLLIDFRRPLDVLLALAPLFLSLCWTLSLMGLLGIPLNLANFFAVPILIGLGVDGAVHLLHRYHEPGGDRLDPGSTRRAFILTNLTTTIGFSPLLFADHRGMISLGSVMVIGNCAALVSLLVVLPALLSLRERRRLGRL